MVIGSAAEEDSPRFSRNVAEKMLARVPRERRVMRKGGVEPPTAFRLPDPKSGASASSATFALRLLEPNGQQSSVTRRPRTDDRVPGRIRGWSSRIPAAASSCGSTARSTVALQDAPSCSLRRPSPFSYPFLRSVSSTGWRTSCIFQPSYCAWSPARQEEDHTHETRVHGSIGGIRVRRRAGGADASAVPASVAAGEEGSGGETQL